MNQCNPKSTQRWTRRGRNTIKRFGYPLKPMEIVHHIDGNNENNNIMNLVVFKNSGQHTTYHAKMKLLDRRKILFGF